MDAVNMRGSEHEWKDVYRMCLIMNQQQLWDVAPSPQPLWEQKTEGEKLCTERGRRWEDKQATGTPAECPEMRGNLQRYVDGTNRNRRVKCEM